MSARTEREETWMQERNTKQNSSYDSACTHIIQTPAAMLRGFTVTQFHTPAIAQAGEKNVTVNNILTLTWKQITAKAPNKLNKAKLAKIKI